MENERVCRTMKFSPLFLIAAASLATVAAGQALTPPARTQAVVPLAYHVRVDWQKAEAGASGLVIRGSITNTGTTPLTYTQVTPTLVDHAGKEIFRGNGYLTASPLLPGQSAEFRACETDAPRFAGLRMAFREAGHPVLVEGPRASVSPKTMVVPAKTARVF